MANESETSLPHCSDDHSDPAERAVELAGQLLRTTLDVRTSREAARMERVARLIEHPRSKTVSMAMTDRLFRSDRSARAASGWRALLRRFGIGDGFPVVDRFMLRLGAFGSRLLPAPVIAAVRAKLRRESSEVILPADDPELATYLKGRRDAGARINLNQLGEAVLGEEEAGRRLDSVLELLGRPDVDYVSVKISAIFSQINLVAWQATLEEIKMRLRLLYRAALPEKNSSISTWRNTATSN